MRIVVFADGASSGNPGPAGLAYVVTAVPCGMSIDRIRPADLVQASKPADVKPGGLWKLHSEARRLVMECGNGRAEAAAATSGLVRACRYAAMLPDISKVELISDAQYVVGAINGWLDGWANSGWRTSKKTDVANRDVWEWYLANTTPEFRAMARALYRSEAHPMIAECDRGASQAAGSRNK